MEFEPFHSDDEDNLSFMPERKKKDEKRRKSKGPFRPDKKDKASFNDNHTPTGMKTKHVHGVVGPAEYINETSPTHGESTTAFVQATTPTAANSQTTANQIFAQTQQKSLPAPQIQQQQLQQQQQHLQQQAQLQQQVQLQQQPNQWPANSSTPQQIPQPFPQHHIPTSPNIQKLTFPNQPGTNQFPSNFPQSTKIERPHSSAALLQERPTPQSPTPFKQPPSTNTPQKMTLLAQAMNAGQTPQPPSAAQQSSAHLTHHRSPSYSRAMSVPLLTKNEKQEPNQFHANFESSLEINTSGLANSPILESPTTPFQKGGSMSSPPLTPSNKISASQELWSNAPVHHHNENPSPVSQHETDWAYFSPQTEDVPDATDENPNHIDIPRKKSQESESMASSIPDSISSVESVEIDDSVWKINEEQRDYYNNQFQKLQPNIGEVIKGPQARDFFLKSTLPTETLSRIWQLSDLDKDGALNLEEFCIAMHLVVAIRHGVELPAVLPTTLLVQDEADPAILENGDGENVEDEYISDEKEYSTEWAAEFHSTEGEPVNCTETIQTLAQPSPTSSTIPTEARFHPVSHDSNYDNKEQVVPIPSPQEYSNNDGTFPPISPLQKDAAGGKNSAIARPRASANKNVNLMDASPWQLLPPPSGKSSKQSAKKSLRMDSVDIGSDPSLSSITSSEGRLDSLVHLDGIDGNEGDFKVSPVNDKNDSTSLELDRLKVKKKDVYYKSLSKEKSRSIDSLRSDISESSMFEWRRQSSRRDSRPRSYTGDNLQHGEVSSERLKEFEIPPVPPPRNKGHARASSLDFNQMFGSKSPPTLEAEARLQTVNDNSPNNKDSKENISPQKPQKPPRSNPPNQGPRSFPMLDDNTHKRSFSLDINLDGNGSHGSLSDSDSNPLKPRDRIRSLGSPLADGKRTNSKEHVVRFNDEPEVLSNAKSPMEIQMRKHELQSRLRDLKSKNTTLLSLISQLDMEWKEVSEERIALDVRLQRVQQEH